MEVRAACLSAWGTKDRQQVLGKVGRGPVRGDGGIHVLQLGTSHAEGRVPSFKLPVCISLFLCHPVFCLGSVKVPPEWKQMSDSCWGHSTALKRDALVVDAHLSCERGTSVRECHHIHDLQQAQEL